MSRIMLAFALACLTVSVAVANDFCLVIDSPTFTDSQFVLQKAKLAPRNVAPIQGYFALFDSLSGTYFAFYPISGQSVVSSAGNGVLGFVMYNIYVSPGGGGGGGTDNSDVTLNCQAGSDGKIGVMDSCSGTINNAGVLTGVVGHFITCGKNVAIP
jgi:hypothetical protein